MEYELYHYGVLGMKWGVRRYQPYTKGKHGTFLGQDRDSDIVIKKGSSAYRLQTGNKLTGSGSTYVSFDKLDSLSYASVTAAEDGGGLNVNMHDGSGTLMTLKVTNDIVAPSYQKTMDAFIKTIDERGVKRAAADIYDLDNKSKKKYWENYDKEHAKQFVKDYKKLSIDECRDRAYESFTRSFMRNTETRKIFFDTLKENGYNAVVDENDKKFGKGFTESPMIIFDKNDNLKVSKALTISDKDANYFYDLYYSGNDPRYLEKRHGNTVAKWDKWAGTTERRGM